MINGTAVYWTSGFGTRQAFASMFYWEETMARQMCGLRRHWARRYAWFLTRHFEALNGAPLPT